MITKEQIKELLIFDIETVRCHPNLETLKQTDERLHNLWLKKSRKYEKDISKDLTEQELFNKRNEIYKKESNLHPEFSKIISLCFSKVTEDDEGNYVIATPVKFTLDNEKELLNKFLDFFDKYSQKAQQNKVNVVFCGHNIISFDIPFLIKRLLINKLRVPQELKIQNKKPWEMPMLDTLRLWKLGSAESTSLDLLCHSLGIESTKYGEVSGDGIGDFYWQHKMSDNIDHALKHINEYCEKDVIATGQVIIELSKF